MKRKPALTTDQINALLVVDLSTGRCFWKEDKYHPFNVGREAGFLCKCGYRTYWVISINGVVYRRSQIMFTVANGRWATGEIDHIDRNSLNDKPENLREVTHQQNSWNQASRARKSNLPMGVRFTPPGRYEARIGISGKLFSLGCFSTPEEAHEAYISAKREVCGEYCGL